MRATRSCILVITLVVGFSEAASAQSLDRFFRGLNDAKRLADEASKVLPLPPAPAPSPQQPTQQPTQQKQPESGTPPPSPKQSAPVRSPTSTTAARNAGPDFSSSDYDKQRYAQFVVPEATQKLADGERKIAVPLDVNESRGDTSAWVMHRTVTNPYLPMEPYILVPEYRLLNHLSQPHGRAQKISIGVQKNPGFFTQIEHIRCMPEGDLLVQGKAGYELEGNPPKGYAGGYANGVWRVAQSGAITPYLVFPGPGRRFDACGDIYGCETMNAPVWERAKQALPESFGRTEDKHGNVWVLNRAEPGGWSVVRFNKDGSEKVVLDRAFLQEHSSNKDDLMPPSALRYDQARDEMVFVHQYWGSGDGAMGIWRITQNNVPKEVLRFLTRSNGALSTPSPNLVKLRASEIVKGLAVDPEGTIWFAVAETAGRGYPSQAYQVVDSIKSMKKLAYASAGQNVYEDLIAQLRLGRKTDAREATLLKAALGQQACFEPTGQYLYIRDEYVGVARLEVKTGRMSTWVR